MKTSLFFRRNISHKKIRVAAKKEQNAIRLRMKKQEESLIFLDFLISSQFVRDEAEGDMSFLPWESPDFLVQMRRKKVGVELTRAVRLHSEARPGPAGPGAIPDPLQQWYEAMMQRIAKKMRKYAKGTIRRFNRNVLIVVDELPLTVDDSKIPALAESVAGALSERKEALPDVAICIKVRRRQWWRIARDQSGVWCSTPFSKEKRSA